MCNLHQKIKRTDALYTLLIKHRTGNVAPMTKESVKFQLGQAVRRVRESKGMTVEELALQAGIDRGNLSKMETGKMGITMERLFDLAECLGLSASELMMLAEIGDEKTTSIVGLLASFPAEQKDKFIELLRALTPQNLSFGPEGHAH